MASEEGPHFCKEVRMEVNMLASKVERILEGVHEVKTQVAVLVNREKPPCEKYDERIEKLENTKSSLSGGWKVLVIVGSTVIGLCTVGALAITVIMLLK